MANLTETLLTALYEADETAWLDAMSRLAAERRFEEFDCENLSEFLESMARRDRREVETRLKLLLMHLLKWGYQPEKRSSSWRITIRNQRWELRKDLEGGTLRGHAVTCLAECYRIARQDAADETGLPIETFPAEMLVTIEDLIGQGEDILL